MPLGPGSLVGGKYRLERALSRGGMGEVWVARHAQLGSTIAVKVMDSTYAGSPAFVARFEREARIAANLKSPHIVHVQDYGLDVCGPYLVMELLEGEDLETRLKRIGRLSLNEAVVMLIQVGKALRRAHEAGLVHRDLKPGNLFLAQCDGDEIVKVLDFGIVKETGSQFTSEVTRTGEVLGSPFYMSPEQIRGDKDLDARSDLWSLGVILFRTLTGVRPFQGDQVGAVIAKILVESPPSATEIDPSLPRAIDGFFARALSRDRSQRFQSVGDMVEALRLLTDVSSSYPSSLRLSFPPSGPEGLMAERSQAPAEASAALDATVTASGAAPEPSTAMDAPQETVTVALAFDSQGMATTPQSSRSSSKPVLPLVLVRGLLSSLPPPASSRPPASLSPAASTTLTGTDAGRTDALRGRARTPIFMLLGGALTVLTAGVVIHVARFDGPSNRTRDEIMDTVHMPEKASVAPQDSPPPPPDRSRVIAGSAVETVTSLPSAEAAAVSTSSTAPGQPELQTLGSTTAPPRPTSTPVSGSGGPPTPALSGNRAGAPATAPVGSLTVPQLHPAARGQANVPGKGQTTPKPAVQVKDWF